MKLNIWNYLVIGVKSIFGGIPSVVCYLAGLVNDKVLSKCDAQGLAKWSRAFVALADCYDRLIEIFYTPGTDTALAARNISMLLRSLGLKLVDAKLSEQEVTDLIGDIKAATKALRTIIKSHKVQKTLPAPAATPSEA